MNVTSAGPNSKLTKEDYEKLEADHRALQEILEKPWAESDTDGKLQKLRTVLGSIQSTTNYLNNRVNRLEGEVFKLKNHNHLEGKVVVALDNNHLGSAETSMGMSQVNYLA